MYAGVDATRDVWMLYSGVTLAPLSEHIHADGVRLRASSGYGEYSLSCTQNCAPGDRFKVSHSYVEALVGYQKRFGELTAKGFVGIISSQHDFEVPEPGYKVFGSEIGVKAALELWLNLGPSAWSSLDLSYATAFETSSARWRLGWRPVANISIGPEVRYDRNVEDDAGRLGLFARYDWAGGEISGAAGYGGAVNGDGADDAAVYGTINVLFQY